MRTENRRFRLSMFAMVYFVQGIALAYFRNFQKPYLDSKGIDADAIGLLTSILLLPFVLKIFIGMLSDRISLFGHGHRKPYIIMGLLLALLSFGVVSLVDPQSSFLLFSVLIVAGSFSVTLFDSTTDGMAIDITPKQEHGTVQGVMVGGRALGAIILSLVFGSLAQSHGYRPVFLIIALGMLIPLFWVFRSKEPAVQDESQAFDWAAFKVLYQKRFVVFALFAIIYSVVSFGVDGLITYFMSNQFQAPETLIGSYGALRGIGAVLGAIGGGILVDRLGRRRSAIWAILLISVGAVLIGLSPALNVLLTLSVIWGIAWGFQETVFFALAMDLTDSRIAASMFAIMMAFSNIGTAIGEGVATGLTDNIGFRPVFLILAVLNILTFLTVVWLFKVAPDIERIRKKSST